MSLILRSVVFLACCTFCFSSYADKHEVEPEWAAPPLEQAISIRDGKTRERLDYDQLIAALAQADAVFVGESHTDDTTHRLQLAIYDSLLKSRRNQVVLALEVFERDVQAALDRYLDDEIDEESFLAESRPWSNYREAYRPLVELAKQAGTPVIAANFPRSLTRRLAMEGPKVLESLSAEEKHWVPSEFFPNTPAYWKRTDNATRGHQGFAMPGTSDDRLYSTQTLWDNSMGEACAEALDNHSGYCVLHINGNFHSAYWDGAVHQLKRRKPAAKIKTISLTPAINPSTAVLRGKPVADYVVYVESRATNTDRGEFGVQVGRELKYRFHLPPDASAESPVPLLIWLTDDGLTAEEAMTLCKLKFGEEAAIATIDAPYKLVGEDYAVGGRWYWPESFTEDVTTLVDGTERIWAYLLRNFPIDADRVCLVGEGTGGTVVSVIAVHSDRMKHQAIAVRPSRYGKVKDIPLPLPEYFGDDSPPPRQLTVVGDDAVRDSWKQELAQYHEVQVSSDFQLLAADPWESATQLTNLVREALGMQAQPVVENNARQYLLVSDRAPRALYWASLQAERIAVSEGIPTTAVGAAPSVVEAKQISTEITAAAAKREGAVPRCPGPFGGTTVLVLPGTLSQEIIDQWLAIEEDDPLAAKSRFHRVRIAYDADGHRLKDVLLKLQSENRKNILVVPAVFYADLLWLRSLRESVLELEDTLTLHWRPGLGGQLGILGE